MTVETMRELLSEMVKRDASDLYLTYNCPPSMRVDDRIIPYNDHRLNDADIEQLLEQILTQDQLDELRSTLELNLAYNMTDLARFRVNVFRQQSHSGAVIRRVQHAIPQIDDLGLPAVYGQLAMEQRGLILLSGRTGSGKSTSLAAMVGHRNTNGEGHIITIEDPIEFVHQHNKCIVTQRDVGLDTYSYSMALKNALRQRPDMIVIGEARDREVMEQAIYYAETGHLCIATVHANNASQTIERVLNFFPEDRHQQILLNLSLNLRAILCQRLMLGLEKNRVLAYEILLNRGLIKQYIEEGKVRQLKDMMEKGGSEGMQTFDQHLFELYNKRIISEEAALMEADSQAGLRLMIQNKKAGERGTAYLSNLAADEARLKNTSTF